MRICAHDRADGNPLHTGLKPGDDGHHPLRPYDMNQDCVRPCWHAQRTSPALNPMRQIADGSYGNTASAEVG